jgi:diguanylate cyclase (GGDEF)-like protein
MTKPWTSPVVWKRKRLPAALLFALLLWRPPAFCLSEAPLVLDSRRVSHVLRPVAGLFEDSTASLTIDEVSSEAFRQRFHPQALEKKFIGYARSRFWLRFTLVDARIQDSDSGPAETWALYTWSSLIDAVDLYTPAGPGKTGWVKTRGGRSRSWQRGGSSFDPIILALHPPPGTPTTFYLCVTNTTALILDFSVEAQTLIQRKIRTLDLVNFMALGLLSGLMLHSFFMGIMLRDLNYLHLTFYCLTGILASLNHHVPAIPLVSDFPPETVDFLRRFSTSVGMVFVILLCRSLFGTAVAFPKTDRVLLALIPCHLLQWTLTGVMDSSLFHGIRFLLLDTTQVMLMVLGTLSWVRGFKPARFFLAAFVIHGGGMLFGMAETYELIPMTVWSSVLIPRALDSAALIAVSLALADSVTRLRTENRALVLTERRLKTLSYTDGLTGLFNRRYLESRLRSEAGHAHRMGKDLCVVIMDVDNFKRFNDTFGHPEGDRVLKTLGEVLRKNVRDIDSACRFGGEEFVALLPDTDPDGAFCLSERVRREFRARTAALEPQGTRTCTLSAGLARLLPDEDGASVLKRADEALYAAKKSGKDRTILAGTLPFQAGANAMDSALER